MSGSINKILNDALDQTILTEQNAGDMVAAEKDLKDRKFRRNPGDMVAAEKDLQDRKFRRNAGDMLAAEKDLDSRNGQVANINDPTGTDAKSGTDWAKYGKYGGIGLAGIGAGIGAVMLAKKLRAKKKAADAKAAKKAKK
jgi:hypothetical protein